MRDVTTGQWLDDLASEAPAPGGGAAAALNAAIGAGLVSMVCNLTIGKPKYAEHENTMRAALEDAERLRAEATSLAEADAEAFTTLMSAYGLPKETDEDKTARREAIQAALVGAAGVPLQIASVAARVIALTDRIATGANVNVLSDVAVAADSARAALRSASLNVDINLGSMKDTQRRETIAAELADYLAAISKADTVVDAVSERIKA